MREGDLVFAPTPPATLLVNGAAHAWRDGLTVADVLQQLGTDEASAATALNGEFVARGARADTPVAPDDRLVVFAAIVGG